jgi:hypothetical protein
MRFLFGCAAATMMACGGHAESSTGLEAPSVSDSAPAYPTGDDFGWNVGNVAPNMAFTGYLHLDPTTTIDPNALVGTVRLSDFYDPHGSRGLTYLAVSVHDAWCPPSNTQEDFTNGANYTGQNTGLENFATSLAAKGVRFLTLLEQGMKYPEQATIDDLIEWDIHHQARVSEGLLAADELSMNVMGNEVPYNVIIDARTMKIVDVSVGFDPQMITLRVLVHSY